MGGQGAIATEVPWPSHYDVADVPPADFTPAALPTDWEAIWNNADEETGILLPLYWPTGKPVKGVDQFGGDLFHSYWYDSTGRRKQMYWADGSPASSYWPDGTQIPLYSPFGEPVTDDVPDPLWTPPEEEPEEPEEPEPEEPEEPEEPAPPLVSKERLQAFTPDDALTDEVAALAVEAATALVEAYTRGRHLDGGGKPRPGITTVILTAAARIGANPGQVSRQDQAGSFSSRRGVGFSGFTLAELAVLNRYRKRATG